MDNSLLNSFGLFLDLLGVLILLLFGLPTLFKIKKHKNKKYDLDYYWEIHDEEDQEGLKRKYIKQERFHKYWFKISVFLITLGFLLQIASNYTHFIKNTYNRYISSETFIVINEGANKGRYQEVKESMNKCANFVSPYFDDKPSQLVIYTYGDRDAFVEGLVNKIGFSRETAEYFRNSSAPRPIDGKLLVPPDQRLKNACHEMVHHYLEGNTHRDNLLNAKWFDEGFASYLAFLFEGKAFNGGMSNWFRKEFKGTTIPIDEMETNNEWNKLHKDMKSRQQAYVEAMLLMNYFFQNYSVDQFKHILVNMKTDPFNVSLKNVAGLSPNEFYNNWLESMK